MVLGSPNRRGILHRVAVAWRRRAVVAGLASATIVGCVMMPAPHADDVFITGRVISVDVVTRVITLRRSIGPDAREVTVKVADDTRVLRLARSVARHTYERAALLSEIKAGWAVSVTSHPAGDRHIAHVVRVVEER